MTNGFWIVAVMIASGLGGEAASPPSDLRAMQGRWQAQAGASRDVRVTLDVDGASARFSIETPQGVKLRAGGEIRLDARTTPRALDWIKLSCDDQELPDVAGIYKLEGDVLTVCSGGFQGARPKEFRPGDGPLADVIIFKRVEVPTSTDATRLR